MGTGGPLIACGIFRNELESVLSDENSFPIHWLDAALHADAERMKMALDQAIEMLQAQSANRVRFLLGNGCHPDIGKIATDCGSCLPPVKNCIQAIIGPHRIRQLEANRTMVITPGWITAWPEIMRGLGWDEVDVRIHLGRYDRLVLLDTGVATVSDEAILAFYDLVQVPIEIEPADLAYFNHLVHQLLNDPC
ncbi:MAG: DUF1638 domain-containing protein [Desulfosarcinaceae bacterium]|nr:DUF1638 domain-containing protein [Desulfosarcinaceae bacterium]